MVIWPEACGPAEARHVPIGVVLVPAQLLVFLNDITRNIIPNNSAEILLVYCGYRIIRKRTDLPL